MLSLKFTFHILKFLKSISNKIEKGIYECLQDKFYMQNVIVLLLHDCIHIINKLTKISLHMSYDKMNGY